MGTENPAAGKREVEQLARQIRHHEAAYRGGSRRFLTRRSTISSIATRSSPTCSGGRRGARRRDARRRSHRGLRDRWSTASRCSRSRSSRRTGKDSKGEPVPLEEQLRGWYDRRRKDLELAADDAAAAVVEPKIDGISVSLLYADGKLARAVTRGDGQARRRHHAPGAKAGAVPAKLRGVGGGGSRCAASSTGRREAFETYNDALASARREADREPAQRVRGADEAQGAGGPRVGGHPLVPLSGPVVRRYVALPETQSEILAWLAEAGAAGLPERGLRRRRRGGRVRVLRGLPRASRQRSRTRSTGWSSRSTSSRARTRLGATDHHPHWAIAYKFPAERKATDAARHHRAGRQERQAHARRRARAGAPSRARRSLARRCTTSSSSSARTCASATRCSSRRRARSSRRSSASISTRRPTGTEKYARPTACPTCGTPVVTEEIFVYCPSPACPDQVRERLRHFASRRRDGHRRARRVADRSGRRQARRALAVGALHARRGAARLARAHGRQERRQRARRARSAPRAAGSRASSSGSRSVTSARRWRRTWRATSARRRRCSSSRGATWRATRRRSHASRPTSGERGRSRGWRGRRADEHLRGARVGRRCGAVIDGSRARPAWSSTAKKAARARSRESPARRSCSPGALPTLKRNDAADRIKAAGGQASAARSRRRPTSSSRARTQAPSSRRRRSSASKVIDEATLLEMLDS